MAKILRATTKTKATGRAESAEGMEVVQPPPATVPEGAVAERLAEVEELANFVDLGGAASALPGARIGNRPKIDIPGVK